MTVSIYRLNIDECAVGQACIGALWQQGHILARDERLFKWQFRSIQQPEKLNFFIAVDDDQPVGCIGRISLPCHKHGRPFSGAAMTNLICLPKYRSKGLGMEIIREAYEGVHYVASVGINEHVAKLYRMMGQYIQKPVPRYTCVANLDSLAETLRCTAHADGIGAAHYAECSRLRLPVCQSCKVEELDSDSLHRDTLLDEWDICWRQHFAPRLQGVVKDAGYMRWRYLEHPIFRYHVLLVRDGAGNIQGLTVLRTANLPAHACAVRVLEFLAADESAGLCLAAAIAERVPSHAAFVEHVALGRQWLPLQHIGLSSHGSELFSVYFNPPDLSHCDITAAFHVKSIDVSAEYFVCSSDSYITIADSDQDRPN